MAITAEEAKELHTKMWKLESELKSCYSIASCLLNSSPDDTWNADRTATLTKRQNESEGNGMEDMLEFLDTKYSELIYGSGASTPLGGAATRHEPASLSLSEMDTSPEGIARKQEHLRRNEAAREAQMAQLDREREILEQWKKEQIEGDS